MSGSAFLDLPRVKYVRGEVALPGSKSISNRVLLLAALAQGSTRIDGLLASDDTTVMLNALQQLGVAITEGLARGERKSLPRAFGQSDQAPLHRWR